MADCMTFPKTFDEFAERYKIVDKKEVYTNGTELIPIFRVEQWIEHLEDEQTKADIRADTVRKMQTALWANLSPYSNYTTAEVGSLIDQIAKEMVEGEYAKSDR